MLSRLPGFNRNELYMPMTFANILDYRHVFSTYFIRTLSDINITRFDLNKHLGHNPEEAIAQIPNLLVLSNLGLTSYKFTIL